MPCSSPAGSIATWQISRWSRTVSTLRLVKMSNTVSSTIMQSSATMLHACTCRTSMVARYLWIILVERITQAVSQGVRTDSSDARGREENGKWLPDCVVTNSLNSLLQGTQGLFRFCQDHNHCRHVEAKFSACCGGQTTKCSSPWGWSKFSLLEPNYLLQFLFQLWLHLCNLAFVQFEIL